MTPCGPHHPCPTPLLLPCSRDHWPGGRGQGQGTGLCSLRCRLPRPRSSCRKDNRPSAAPRVNQNQPTATMAGGQAEVPQRMPAGPGFSSPLPSRAPECVGGTDTSRLLGRGGWMGWARARLSSTLRRAECDPNRNAVFRSQYWHRSQGRARPWGLGLPGAEAGPQPMEDGGAASPRTKRCIRAGVAVPAPGRSGDVGAQEHMIGPGTQPCAKAVAEPAPQVPGTGRLCGSAAGRKAAHTSSPSTHTQARKSYQKATGLQK